MPVFPPEEIASLDYGAPSQSEINRLKNDMRRKRRAYNNALKAYGAYNGVTQTNKMLYEKALAKLNAARAERDAARSTSVAATTTTDQSTYQEMIQRVAAENVAAKQSQSVPLYPPRPVRPLYPRGRFYRRRGFAPRGGFAAWRRRRMRQGLVKTPRERLQARQDAILRASMTPREYLRYQIAQKDAQAEMGALAMELGALEAELDAIHADMNGFGEMHYGDLGADGRGATAGGATAAGAGTSAALYSTGVVTGSSAAGAASAAGAGIVGASAAGLAVVAAPAALVAGGAAWALSWRASSKNIARLQKKIKALRRKMKLATTKARSRAHARRLKRRYQRRIDRAKRRLDSIRRRMRRRIARAKKRGNMDRVKKLRAKRRAALYGKGRKRYLRRKKKRAAKRAAAAGDAASAAALEAEAEQIDSLPDEAFVTDEDYELDPELAAQLGPGALAVQQARMAQGLPPTVTQQSISRARVLNAMLRRRRQNATGYDDDALLDETPSLMPPESPRDLLDLDDDLGAPSLFRDEEGKIKPAVYVVGAVAGLFVFNKMRKKSG